MKSASPLFLLLGDQYVNLAHIQAMTPVPDERAPCKVTVALDLGKRTFSWSPKTKEELDWLQAAIGLLRPGQLPLPRPMDGPLLATEPQRRAPARKA